MLPADRLGDVLSGYGELPRDRPEEPWWYAEYADALHRTGRTDDALDAYDQALALAPEEASFHFNKAQLLFGLGRFAEASAGLREVIRLRPNDVLGARVLLGAIAWPQGVDAAAEHFEAALGSPGERLAPFTRAFFRSLALAGLGRPHDAIAELTAALPARTGGESELDSADRRLLDLLRDPPLPGLDKLRELLGPDNLMNDERDASAGIAEPA